jgi:hypothetical protein
MVESTLLRPKTNSRCLRPAARQDCKAYARTGTRPMTSCSAYLDPKILPHAYHYGHLEYRKKHSIAVGLCRGPEPISFLRSGALLIQSYVTACICSLEQYSIVLDRIIYSKHRHNPSPDGVYAIAVVIAPNQIQRYRSMLTDHEQNRPSTRPSFEDGNHDIGTDHNLSAHLMLAGALKESYRASNEGKPNGISTFLRISSRTTVWRRGWKVPLGIVSFYLLGQF